MTGRRPICAHCGKVYGQRAVTQEHIFWPLGEPKPAPYHGNQRVIKERVDPSEEALAAGTYRVDKDGREGRVIDRTLWDGETYWKPYEPFCTLRCALAYARYAVRKLRGQ